jgi:hypothetical protein
MKYARFVIVLALAVVVGAPLVVYADPDASAQRLSAIQQRCTVLQTILNQLQRRDLVARTNRGREYEDMNRQIDAFSQRLRHNNISDASLTVSVTNFRTYVNTFREAYARYDDSMSNLLRSDCNGHTADFSDALAVSRVLRAAVGVQVTNVENALLAYRQAVVALQTQVPAPLNGGSSQ